MNSIMKKIFTICAALVAAMTMSAAITEMTCAEAAAAAALLEDKTAGKDSVAVTGYVTNTDGKISKGQQVFWMDDEKGTKKTFEGYWCNLPEGEGALNVGDKVVIKGFLMRYSSTYEMKNGDITILERANVKFDTIPVTICEAIEEGEALADGDNTQDYFVVEGVVSTIDSQNDTYHTQQFNLTCDKNSKTLQAYNVTMDGDYAAIGDSVLIIGKLKKFGSIIEIIGDGKVTKKSDVKIDTLSVTVAEALAAAQALENGATSKEVYAVTGYVDSISYAYSEQYDNISFFMCDDMANPVYEFQAYRAKGGKDLNVGTKVIVTGNLIHYYKAATEDKAELHSYQMNAGATIEIVGGTEGVENITIENAATKLIENGQLVIIRNGVRYNAAGTVIE